MITRWDDLPQVMQLSDMAALLGRSIKTLQNRCYRRTMRPAPVSWQGPFAWNKDHVREHFERRADQPKPASRFFAKARARRKALGMAS